MNEIKARYSVKHMNLQVSNVARPDGAGSFVQLTAVDDTQNEIIIELSADQSQQLEDEFYHANRRREALASSANGTRELPANPALYPPIRTEDEPQIFYYRT